MVDPGSTSFTTGWLLSCTSKATPTLEPRPWCHPWLGHTGKIQGLNPFAKRRFQWEHLQMGDCLLASLITQGQCMNHRGSQSTRKPRSIWLEYLNTLFYWRKVMFVFTTEMIPNSHGSHPFPDDPNGNVSRAAQIKFHFHQSHLQAAVEL